MRTNNEQIKIIVEGISRNKIQKKKMNKIISLTLTGGFVIMSCIITPRILQQKEISIAQVSTVIEEKSQVSNEINIPIINLHEDKSSMDLIGIIIYDGKIYTQSGFIENNEFTKQNLIGEYIGTAKGNININSRLSDNMYEFSSTVKGDIYTVKGYDKSFRICIPEMNTNSGVIAFYENLNGITLSTGKDLYGTRIHLKENYIQAYQLKYDISNDIINKINYSELTNDDIGQFIDALYNSPFVDFSTSNEDIFNMNIKHVSMGFKMKDETTIKIRLYENGLVYYEGMYGKVFVQMNDSIFQKIYKENLK